MKQIAVAHQRELAAATTPAAAVQMEMSDLREGAQELYARVIALAGQLRDYTKGVCPRERARPCVAAPEACSGSVI